MGRFNVVTRLIRREPVAFQGCVQATLAALAGFGVINWSSEQVGLMLAVIAAFLALFTRAAVSPTGGTTPQDHENGASSADGGTPLRGPTG